MPGISPGAALIGFLVLGFIFLVLVGLAYLIMGYVPSHSGDTQFLPSDERTRSAQNSTSDPYMPPQLRRWVTAFLTAVIWFALWVIFTNVLLWKPKDSQWRNLSAEAFGYASVTVAGFAVVIWCAVWLWRRFVRDKRTP